jgi:hypothetical protein
MAYIIKLLKFTSISCFILLIAIRCNSNMHHDVFNQFTLSAKMSLYIAIIFAIRRNKSFHYIVVINSFCGIIYLKLYLIV